MPYLYTFLQHFVNSRIEINTHQTSTRVTGGRKEKGLPGEMTHIHKALILEQCFRKKRQHAISAMCTIMIYRLKSYKVRTCAVNVTYRTVLKHISRPLDP